MAEPVCERQRDTHRQVESPDSPVVTFRGNTHTHTHWFSYLIIVPPSEPNHNLTVTQHYSHTNVATPLGMGCWSLLELIRGSLCFRNVDHH